MSRKLVKAIFKATEPIDDRIEEAYEIGVDPAQPTLRQPRRLSTLANVALYAAHSKRIIASSKNLLYKNIELDVGLDGIKVFTHRFLQYVTNRYREIGVIISYPNVWLFIRAQKLRYIANQLTMSMVKGYNLAVLGLDFKLPRKKILSLFSDYIFLYNEIHRLVSPFGLFEKERIKEIVSCPFVIIEMLDLRFSTDKVLYKRCDKCLAYFYDTCICLSLCSVYEMNNEHFSNPWSSRRISKERIYGPMMDDREYLRFKNSVSLQTQVLFATRAAFCRSMAENPNFLSDFHIALSHFSLYNYINHESFLLIRGTMYYVPFNATAWVDYIRRMPVDGVHIDRTRLGSRYIKNTCPSVRYQKLYERVYSDLSYPISNLKIATVEKDGVLGQYDENDLLEIDLYDEFYPDDDDIVANMEEPHGECDAVEATKTENVIITTHASSSEAKPITVVDDDWDSLCSSQVPINYDALTNRFLAWQTLTWKSTDHRGKELLVKTLPLEFVKDQANSPNCVLFSNYTYLTTDLEVRLQVNASKFHCGQLQASFYYAADSDKYYPDRKNVYTASQMSHALIDAGTSNDAILSVPFRYYKPLIATYPRDDDKNYLNLGNLLIMVLSPLTISTNEATDVNVIIYLRFRNLKFYGMRPRDLTDSNMFNVLKAVKAVEAGLEEWQSDGERDNPPQIGPINPVVPWSAHSWAIGNNIPEPTNVLRLDGIGQTPYPGGTLPVEDEMSLSYVKRIFGLIKQIVWSTSDVAGKTLLQLDFSPMPSHDILPRTTIDHGGVRSCFVLPPVAMLSHMFNFWRGSCEYRFDFVSTQFHTGRLILAFVPRTAKNNFKLSQLHNCDHVIMDIRDNKQYVYTQNFLSDKPWWPRRSHSLVSTEKYSPGQIILMVANPLRIVTGVASSIDINVYMRGGEDLEFAVPVPPDLALSHNTAVSLPVENLVTYLTDYGPPKQSIYIDVWRSLPSLKLILRYGEGSDHITQFVSQYFKFKTVYALYTGVNGLLLDYLEGDGSASTHFRFFVRFTTGDQYVYMVPFTTEDAAWKFVDSQDSKGLGDNNLLSNKTWSNSKANVFTEIRYWYALARPKPKKILSQSDERKEVCGMDMNLHGSVKSTGSGVITFGERFEDLKTLCRRYQPYGLFTNPSFVADLPSCANLSFPVLPQGLDLTFTLNVRMANVVKDVLDPYANYIRDGVIPLVASGFRFFRGGLRFRLIIASKLNHFVWVQHRPSDKVSELKITKISYNNETPSKKALFHPGYASLFQGTAVNGIVEFEVPFYLPGQFGLLQRPDLDKVEDAPHYTLGNIFIGLSSCDNTSDTDPFTMAIFYALADDHRFMVFQGFPPVFPLLDIIAQSDNEEVVAATTSSWNPFTLYKDYQKKIMVESISTVVMKEKERLVEAINEPTSTDDKAVLAKKLAALNTEGLSLEQIIENILISMGVQDKGIIYDIVVQMGHVMVNPSWKTAIWCILSFIVKLGLLAYDSLTVVFNAFKKYFKRWLSKTNSKPGEIVSQSASKEEIEDRSAFLSTCVAGILCVLGAKTKPIPANIPDFASYLRDGLPKFTFTANGLCLFFKNSLRMFTHMWQWVIAKFFPNYAFRTLLATASAEVKLFVERASWCLDARNETKIKSDPRSLLLVYECANIARVLQAKMATSEITTRAPVLENLVSKILNLQDSLVRELKAPPIRFEPFVIHLVGPPGHGKSTYAHFLAHQLLKFIGYKSYDEMVYVRTPGNAYWNNLRNQPVCIYDDFLAISDAIQGTMQAGELFCLKSKAVFNPPMAAIEDKNIRYNPLIVILCSNAAFPVCPGIADKQAFWRRRDVLVDVQVKPELMSGNIPDIRSFSHELRSTFSYLSFTEYPVVDVETANTSRKTVSASSFMSDIAVRFSKYYHSEMVQYNETIKLLRDMIPDIDAKIAEGHQLATLLDSVEALERQRIQDSEYKEIKKWQLELESLSKRKPIFDYKNLQQKIIKPMISLGDDHIVANIGGEETYVPDEYVSYLDKTIATITNELDVLRGSKEERDIEKRASLLQEKTRLQDIKCNVSRYDRATLETAGIKLINGEIVSSAAAQEYNYDKFDPTKSLANQPHEALVSCGCIERVKNIAHYVLRNENPDCDKWMSKRDYKDIGAYEYRTLSDKHFTMMIPCSDTCKQNQTEEYDRITRLLYEIEQRSVNEKYYSARIKQYVNTLNNGIRSNIVEAMAEVDDTSWTSKLSNLGRKIFSVLKASLKYFAIFGVVSTALYKLYRFFFPRSEEQEAVGQELKCEATSKHLETLLVEDPTLLSNLASSGSVTTVGKKIPKVIVNAVSNSENTTLSHVIDLVARNTFFLKCKGLKARCLAIGNRFFLMIDHYAMEFRLVVNPDDFVECHLYDGTVKLVRWSDINYAPIPSSVLLLAEFPPVMPPFKNIIKFFGSKKVHQNFDPAGLLVEVTSKQKYLVVNNIPVRIKNCEAAKIKNTDGSYSVMRESYMYGYGGRGVCGSILCLTAPLNTPIIGFHVAGKSDDSVGYSVPLYQEMFYNLERILVVPQDDDTVSNMYVERDPRLLLDEGVVHVGVVKKSLAVNLPSVSRLGHTECFDKITPSTYDRSVLGSNDKRLAESFSPLLEGCRFHGQVPIDFPQNLVDRAYMDLSNKINTTVKPLRNQVGKLSIEQAICGISTIPQYEPLKFETSEGFPWVHSRPQDLSGKRWLFDLDLKVEGFKLLGINKELEQRLHDSEAMRAQGIIPHTIFMDVLKDEKLPKEKCTIPGKTRIFSTSPVDLSIQNRQFFYDFTVAYQEARWHVEHAIGIDIVGYECDHFVKFLLDNSQHIVTGDYKKFGPTLMSTVVMAAFKIIQNWYEYNGDSVAVHKRIREVMAEEIIFSRHIMLDQVYQVMCGAPSGSFLTTILNSLVNCLYIRVMWQIIMLERNPRLSSLSAFNKHVRLVTYGDDIIMSVTEDAVFLFNALELSKAFAKYGIVFTDATKSTDVKPYSDILSPDVTFLKRRFLKHPLRRNIYMSQLEPRALFEICNWYWTTNKDKRAASIEACEAMMGELSHGLGPIAHAELRQRVISFWQHKDVVIQLPTWEELDVMIYSK
ncbi:MAG: polyprotein [Sanya iflavirus 8]|nr:MAG: polyprotein [Sanya iflavirus 8]